MSRTPYSTVKHMKDLTGAPAHVVWETLLSQDSDLENIAVFTYRFLPKLQDRSETAPQDSILFKRAGEMAISMGIQFHESAILTAFAEGKFNPNFLDTLCMANPKVPDRRWLSRNDVAAGKLQSLALETLPPDALSVTSEVQSQSGSLLHFPMCDLRCAVTPMNQEQAIQLGNYLLPQGGLLLVSSESYHLLGTKVVSYNELIRFFGLCLMFSPIIDRMYVAHHLIRGYGSLRISKNRNSDHVPIVVRQF